GKDTGSVNVNVASVTPGDGRCRVPFKYSHVAVPSVFGSPAAYSPTQSALPPSLLLTLTVSVPPCETELGVAVTLAAPLAPATYTSFAHEPPQVSVASPLHATSQSDAVPRP